MSGTVMAPTPERHADVGGVQLCYQTFGEEGRPALLLIMGLGMQMVGWHEDFCTALAERGLMVIRFDNRDVGCSTRFDSVPPPRPLELVLRRPKRIAYTLVDMADDAAGLLDQLGIESAHVVGASMGGMTAQTLAARHVERVRSLVSIMSTTGSRWVGQPAARVYPFFLARPATSRAAYVERIVRIFDVIGSPGFERDVDDLRRTAEQSFDRGASADGTARQLAAILAAGNRTTQLAEIRAPTLVIHGSRDRMVSLSGGRASARAIPGARLQVIDGMGHDLPRGVWPRIIDSIVENARRAGENLPVAAPSSGPPGQPPRQTS